MWFVCFVVCLYFFSLTCQCQFADTGFGQIFAGAEFCRLHGFFVVFASCVLLLDWIYGLCRPWVVFFMVFDCCSIFFDKISPDTMLWEISRPTGPPNHVCPRPPVSNLPCFCNIMHHCTHTHPYTPIDTHMHPIYVKLNLVLVIYINFFNLEKYRCKYVHVKHINSRNINPKYRMGT